MKRFRYPPEFRYAAAIAACLLAGAPLAAQAASHERPHWIADAQTGCKVWNPAPQPHETVRWSGPCKAGFAEGEGTLQWFENGVPGDRYTGGYKHGHRDGYGVLTLSNGETIRGDWSNGGLVQLPPNEINFVEHR
ncbi:MAG TPA: hypothetical protein VJR47_08260 [Stellaceae bacterium]|nr:hypothetical protein [Stellaceae bacterium]